MHEPTLRPEAQHHLNRIGQADLVVGIPTYGNAPTVGMVVQTVLDGVGTDLKGLRVVLINADAAISYGTRVKNVRKIAKIGLFDPPHYCSLRVAASKIVGELYMIIICIKFQTTVYFSIGSISPSFA